MCSELVLKFKIKYSIFNYFLKRFIKIVLLVANDISATLNITSLSANVTFIFENRLLSVDFFSLCKYSYYKYVIINAFKFNFI